MKKSSLLSLISRMDLLHFDAQDLFEYIEMHRLPRRFEILCSFKAGSKERQDAIDELRKSIATEEGDEITDVPDTEEDAVIGEEHSEISVDDIEGEKEDAELTMEAIISSIESIDRGQIFAGEGDQFLVEHQVNRIWNHLLKADESGQAEKCVEEFRARESSGKWFDHIREKFMTEYSSVMSVKKDKACCFYEPNLMQKLMVYKGMAHQNYGNWCDTGTGKSFARDLLSRALDARVSVYILPNNTIGQVERELREKHYHDSVVVVPQHPDEVPELDRSSHNYILLNYDKFNQPNTEDWINAVVGKNPGIDYICLDEVHNVRVRNEGRLSARYTNVLAFVTRAREASAGVRVVAMSATPLVLTLTEVVMLLKLLTGYDYSKEIGRQFTYRNIHHAYKMLVLNGFRYLKGYDEIKQANDGKPEFVETDGAGIFEEFARLEKQDALPIERLLLPLRMEAIRNRLSKGTVLYVHYIDHGKFIPAVQEFVKASGFSSVTHTGDDDANTRRESLEKFSKGMVDIMILSSTGSAGLDGLQKSGHQIIPLILPWTAADMKQLRGRIVRTGYEAGKPVSIVIPQVVFNLPDGRKYSWDKDKWSLIATRQNRMEMVMDGDFSGVKDYDEKEVHRILLNKAIEASECALSEQVVVREKVKSSDIEIIAGKRECSSSMLNEVLRKASSSRPENIWENCYHSSSEKFREYHRLRRESVDGWPRDPVDEVARIIQKYKPEIYKRVIDLGCGENLLKSRLTDRETVGVDVERIDDSVIKANCSDLHGVIDDESFRIAVHCLSLWGNSIDAYMREDYRILESGVNAQLIIVEPADKFAEGSIYGTVEEFLQKVESFGFRRNGCVEDIDRFKVFQFTK